jgi:transcriptional regulator with XRE-family HTH domain
MQEPRQWRELLGLIVDTPTDKQRLAHKLGIDPLTLIHWIYGESYPRPQQLYQLLAALPDYADDLAPFFQEAYTYIVTTRVEALSKDMPPEMSELLRGADKPALPLKTKGFELFDSLMSEEDEEDEISSVFYARILSIIASTPSSLRFSSLTTAILQQALMQLDPQRKGLLLTLMRCMPPRDGKIRSLRTEMGMGTPPWSNDLTQHTCFVGAHSVAEHALRTGRAATVNLSEDEDAPLSITDMRVEASAAVCPILRAHEIAGCLLISSTQYRFFTSPRLTLLQCYADLLALVFEPDEFYALQQVELCKALPSEQQRSVLATFRLRVSALLMESLQNGCPLSVAQAEMLVWQQLEDELLQ